MTPYEKRRNAAITKGIRAVLRCRNRLARKQSSFKQFELLWRLAWVQLRDLEEYRIPGAKEWPQ